MQIFHFHDRTADRSRGCSFGVYRDTILAAHKSSDVLIHPTLGCEGVAQANAIVSVLAHTSATMILDPNALQQSRPVSTSHQQTLSRRPLW